MNNNIIEAYEMVIADLEQDIGYIPGAHETAVSVLEGRKWELQNIWGHTKETVQENA
jgi:hypothetical protein